MAITARNTGFRERIFTASGPTRENASWGSERLVRILRTILPLRGNGLRGVCPSPRSPQQTTARFVPALKDPALRFCPSCAGTGANLVHCADMRKRRCPCPGQRRFFCEPSAVDVRQANSSVILRRCLDLNRRPHVRTFRRNYARRSRSRPSGRPPPSLRPPRSSWSGSCKSWSRLACSRQSSSRW